MDHHAGTFGSCFGFPIFWRELKVPHLMTLPRSLKYKSGPIPFHLHLSAHEAQEICSFHGGLDDIVGMVGYNVFRSVSLCRICFWHDQFLASYL